MTRLSRLLLLLLCLLTTALAVGQLAPNVTLTQASTALLPLKRVQSDLKLTAQQKKALEADFKGYEKKALEIRKTAKSQKDGITRITQAKFATANKALGRLTSAQRVRLRQIGMQAYGIFAVLAPDMTKELGLKPQQVAAIKKAQADSMKQANALRLEVEKAARSVPPPKNQKDQKAMLAYVKKVRSIMAARNSKDRQRMKTIKARGEARALAVLSAAQRKKWTAMQGKKLTLEG